MEFQYERVPRWILPIGIAGAAISTFVWGPFAGLAYALGTLGSWWNYQHLVKTVTTLTSAAASGAPPRSGVTIAGMLLRFVILGLVAIAILKYSRSNGIALGLGLFASFTAICLEILFGRLWNSTKSG